MKFFDLLIKEARVIDGTENPPYWTDIGVKDGRIVEIRRKIEESAAEQVLKADGLTVSPGFIDTHTHDDGYLFCNPRCDEKVMQGVTTVVIGNCGYSLAPITQDRREEMRRFLGLLGAHHLPEDFWDIGSMGGLLDRLEDLKPGINIATLLGHQILRIAVMGMEGRPATNSELEKMQALTEEAMDGGAIGFSTGLNYAPGSFADRDELVKIASIVGRKNGIYTTHLRDEAGSQLEAIREAIDIAREAGCRAHISHHKVMCKSNWGQSIQTLGLIEEARNSGLEITCDLYPYTAGSTFLAAALPLSFQAGGPEAAAEKLKSPEVRQELIKEMENPSEAGLSSVTRDIGFENVYISTTKKHPEYIGRSLAEIGESERRSPFDVFFDLVMEEKMDVTIIVFMMEEGDVERILKSPFSMIGSDGIPDFGSGTAHPRFRGTFPKILRRFVRELGLMSLPEAVRKMTSLPARTFGLRNKGLVLDGYDADLVIFDPDSVADTATYESPAGTPQGIHWVVVNGKIVVDKGQVLEAKSGGIYRRRNS